MKREDYLKLLAMAFRDLHFCEAKHLETLPVLEQFQGKTAWEGEVEVFGPVWSPQSQEGLCLAAQNGKQSDVTAVLEIPPVISPETAVMAFIVSRNEKNVKLFLA